MKNKTNLDFALDCLLVALSVLILVLVAASIYQFDQTKAVYQGF